MATVNSKTTSAERAVIVQALELMGASLRRAANTEKDAAVREIREKSLIAVQNLTAKVQSTELEL